MLEIVNAKGVSWRTQLGKPAKMWFFGDWVVQLEIDGKIPVHFSYSESKRIFTGLGGAWILVIVIGYVLFRLAQRYALPAFKEAYRGPSEP